MPGFILHLAEAKTIADHMKKQEDADWCRDFYLGSLLPDTKLGEDKRISHFWSPEHADYIARAPKLEKFLEKYGHRLNEPVMFGYYAHLYLDEKYVDNYWPKNLVFEDENGHPEPRRARIHQVKLLHKGIDIPFDQFFTAEYYYGDYTRSNHWFVEHYRIQPPEFKHLDVGMSEVDPDMLHRELEELAHICRNGKLGDEKQMKVFDLESLDSFVRETAESFCRHMAQMYHIK